MDCMIVYLYTLAFSAPFIFGIILDTKETRKATKLIGINHLLVSICFYASYFIAEYGPIAPQEISVSALSSILIVFSVLAPFLCRKEIRCFSASLLIPITNAGASVFTILIYRWVSTREGDYFFDTHYEILLLPLIMLCCALFLQIRIVRKSKHGSYRGDDLIVKITSFRIKQIIKAFIIPIIICSLFRGLSRFIENFL